MLTISSLHPVFLLCMQSIAVTVDRLECRFARELNEGGIPEVRLQ